MVAFWLNLLHGALVFCFLSEGSAWNYGQLLVSVAPTAAAEDAAIVLVPVHENQDSFRSRGE